MKTPENNFALGQKKTTDYAHQSRLEHHETFSPIIDPNSGGPKPSPNPARAAGPCLSKMGAPDTSGLCFGPSTRRWKANDEPDTPAKVGPQLGHS